MRLDIDGLRGANPSLHTRQAGGNWVTRYEKAGSIGMMAPADAGNAGEISRRGGLTAGQTAHEALSFRQFDQSGHPSPNVSFSAVAPACRTQGGNHDFPVVPRNTGQHVRRQREITQKTATETPLLSCC